MGRWDYGVLDGALRWGMRQVGWRMEMVVLSGSRAFDLKLDWTGFIMITGAEVVGLLWS